MSKTSATPEPIVPKPIIATFIIFILPFCFCIM
jgi:hypothetical protein